MSNRTPARKLYCFVRYTRSDRAHGEAFSVSLSESHGRQVF